jgi:hypothetical protein
MIINICNSKIQKIHNNLKVFMITQKEINLALHHTTTRILTVRHRSIHSFYLDGVTNTITLLIFYNYAL